MRGRGWLAGLLLAAYLAGAPSVAQSVPAGASVSSEKVRYFRGAYDAAADPAKDVQAAGQIARDSNRRVLVEVGGDWCSWCKILDHYVMGNSKVRDAMADSFVIVKVNWSPENKNEAFLGKYPPIDGYPHFLVLEPDGTLAKSVGTEQFERGDGYNVKKLIAFAQSWDAK